MSTDYDLKAKHLLFLFNVESCSHNTVCHIRLDEFHGNEEIMEGH